MLMTVGRLVLKAIRHAAVSEPELFTSYALPPNASIIMWYLQAKIGRLRAGAECSLQMHERILLQKDVMSILIVQFAYFWLACFQTVLNQQQ